jgi:acyl carrier protein
MLDEADTSVRTRIFGVVNALMRRRELPLLVRADQSLRDAGLKSLDLVNMMLAIEDEFGIEIPQDRLSMDHFRDIGAIERLVSEVSG